MGPDFVVDDRLKPLLELIDEYYRQVDRDRVLIENALAVNSEELESLYARLRERTEAERAMFRSFTTSVPDLFFVKSPQGQYRGCNPAFEKMLGLQEHDVIGRTVHDVLPSEMAEEITVIETAVMASGQPDVREQWIRIPTGDLRCLEMLRAPYFASDGTPLGLIGIGRDVTDRRRLEDQMRLASLVYQHTGEGMLVTDAEFRIIDINPACTRITGYRLDEVLGRTPEMFNSGRQDRAFYDEMHQVLQDLGYWHGEVEDRRKGGQVYTKSMVVNRLLEDEGAVQGYVMLFSDVTQKKEADEKIWKQANLDALTGLPNRRMLRERLEHELRQADRGRCSVGVLLIDLDHFKEVNDTLGHLVGDDLLVEAARRISACTRETDIVARLGGDEFIVILTRVGDPRHVEAVATKIIDRLAEPFQLGESSAYVSASVGVTLYPQDAREVEDLIKSADQAMYAAKRQGRNRFSHFTQGLQTAAQERLRMIVDLRAALEGRVNEGGQLRLHFQPIVDTRSGHIHRAEALIRWEHPTRGSIEPDQFIGRAEETGLIVKLGDLVFHEAARWAARWHAIIPGFQVSVNVSPVQFRPEGAASRESWIGLMGSPQLPPGSMVVEITEGVLLQPEVDPSGILSNLRKAGIEVALDDFGKGYSSLGFLNRYQVDLIKIDQEFVSRLTSPTADCSLCEAIIVMAHKLGLKVVAEGVETQVQADLLSAAGCDSMQGYLFSRPIPPEQLEAILRHGAKGR
jgi:diguanylate cyclase (GGDEF)-like protein/PAS domain S-box-containing protein